MPCSNGIFWKQQQKLKNVFSILLLILCISCFTAGKAWNSARSHISASAVWWMERQWWFPPHVRPTPSPLAERWKLRPASRFIGRDLKASTSTLWQWTTVRGGDQIINYVSTVPENGWNCWAADSVLHTHFHSIKPGAIITVKAT